VRGLNDGVRQDVVNELVRQTGSTIVCLQETKLQLIDQSVVQRTIGPKFINSYAVLPAVQTKGGILLAVNEDYFDLSNIQPSTNAITATITMRADRVQWQVTVVYGPQGDAAKTPIPPGAQRHSETRPQQMVNLGRFQSHLPS
jgi:exonuclease III